MKSKISAKKVLIVVFLLIIIVYIIFASRIFRIKYVSVYGNNKIQSNEILNYAEIKGNENYFRLSGKDIEERVYNTKKFERVEVNKGFPNKLEINVTERKPAAIFKIKDGYLTVDRFGIILEKLPESDSNLKYIKGIELNQDFKIGTNLRDYVDDKKKELIDNIFSGNNIFKYNEIELFEKEANLILANDVLVKFGNYKDTEYKLNVIDEIVETTEREKFSNVKAIRLEDGKNPILVFE